MDTANIKCICIFGLKMQTKQYNVMDTIYIVMDKS